MKKSLELIGLPAILAIFSALTLPILWNMASSLVQKPVVTEALAQDAQPSTVITIEANSEYTAGDRMAHPPTRQTFTTPSEEGEPYRLVIATEDNWRSPLTQAKLFQGETILWEIDLPHQYGPKFVLISATGNVLLLDEFINVASPHAITLINKKGQTIAQHGFKDIEAALNLSAADLTKQATTGWWISAAPLLIEDGKCAAVPTAGTLLEINLINGNIGPRNPASL